MHSFTDHDADRQSREQALGPVVVRVPGRVGIGAPPTDVHQKIPMSCVDPVLLNLGRRRVNRLGCPSPFFDARSRFPVVEPRVLFTKAREHLRPRVRTQARDLVPDKECSTGIAVQHLKSGSLLSPLPSYQEFPCVLVEL